MSDFIVSPLTHSIHGSCRVASDKSISHRSIIFASLANGVSRISNLLDGEDVLHTLAVFKKLGVQVDEKDHFLYITGVGLHGLRLQAEDNNTFYMGNSGTSARLLSGILAAQNFESTITGDTSLSARPMGRVTEPLKLLGAKISSNSGKLPLVIKQSQGLKSIKYEIPVASAQVKSALLLAGLYINQGIEVTETNITRDHTEKMMQTFGVNLEIEEHNSPYQKKIRLKPNQKFLAQEIEAQEIEVPADISSASFFIVLVAVMKGSEITLKDVGINATRDGILKILKLMGANIVLENERFFGKEPVADIIVTGADLQVIDVPQNLVSLAIDEFPVIFVAAALAKKGEVMRITGVAELRVKESDRIAVMAKNLQALGVRVEELKDGALIYPLLNTKLEQKAAIHCHKDHRIAMAMSVAACFAKSDTRIEGVEEVKTSFPNFVHLMNAMDILIKEV